MSPTGCFQFPWNSTFVARRRCLWYISIVVLCAAAPPALAFPSPEIVINLFGSGAQLLGMFAASVGTAWFGIRKGKTSHATTGFRASLFLLCVLGASLLCNAWQYWQHAEQQARRLQANLLRPSPPTHPIRQYLGLERSEFQRWLQQDVPHNLIDVREPEEFELGYVPGARHSRYAELLGRDRTLLRRDVPNVLVCDSGFRSGEICSALAAEGIPCRFVQGGYAKWVTEGRPMSGVKQGNGPTLQALPRYRHDNVLLDTPEVDRLVRDDKAQVIDVRAPLDFRQNHLPNAVNIPVREETTDHIAAALAALPHVPLIATCYDNRSCFYAKVIGLRLTRMGLDFRGRYTMPHEYPIPDKLKGSLALRKANALTEQWLFTLGSPPRKLLEKAQSLTGSLAIGVVLLAVIVRMLFVPATWIAERSRERLRLLEAQRPDLQRRYAGDEQGERRAWRRLLQREGISAGRDFLLGLLQLAVLTSCLHAVSETVARAPRDRLLDMSDGSRWHHALPIMLAAAVAVYLAGLMRRRHWWRWPLIGTFGASVGYGAASLVPAVNLYLITSAVLLTAQQWLVRRRWRMPVGMTARHVAHGQVVSLFHAMAHPAAGPKAVALSRMLRARLPVPDGFVVIAGGWMSAESESRARVRRQAHAALRRLTLFGLRPCAVAVRSSAADEDAMVSSQAGRYLTQLGVGAREVGTALDSVCESCAGSDGAGAAIVQPMIAAEYAGVIFTEAPDSSGTMLVEMALRPGAVVSGKEVPHAVRIGRASGIVFESVVPPMDLAPLWQLAQRVETLFGVPQDIEWAYCKGRFHLLQARPITRRVVDGDSVASLREQERARLLGLARRSPPAPDADWLVIDDLTAELPQATPMSLSLLAALRGPAGSTELAWRRLGFAYAEENAVHWVTAFGHTRVIHPDPRRALPRPGIIAQLRFAHQADVLVDAFENEFLPSFRRAMRLRRALDLTRLDTAELLRLFCDWSDEFVRETYVESEVINLAADLHDRTARMLLKRFGLDPAVYLRPDCPLPGMRAMECMIEVRAGRTAMTEFIDEFGHRAPHDFELSEARYREGIDQLNHWPNSLPDMRENGAPPLPRQRWVAAAVARARRYLALKEEAKHECTRSLDNLRRLLLELDCRLDLSGMLFYATLEELKTLSLPMPYEVRERISKRAASQASFAQVRLPSQLSLHALEQLNLASANDPTPATGNELRGMRVAGSGQVSGKACVLDSPSMIGTFRKGDILVIPTADPAWITLFPQAAGIVCETGGWLCHAAIMAREFAVPAVFGVTGAMTQICDGDHLLLEEQGRVIHLAPRGDRSDLPSSA